MTREEQLRAIKAADHAYYDLDAPTMPDSVYDELRNDYIKKYGSDDLDYVPGKASGDFEKFRHPIPVTSLAKVKFETEKEKLRAQISRLWPVVHEPKLDGLTIVAYPNEDGSCKFVTRGQGGLIGEILPNFIKKYEGKKVNMTGFAIRGEAFIDFDTFNSINKEREEEGLEPFSNPRNAAAGILRNKERSPYIDRLRYMVYDILGMDDTTEISRITTLESLTSFEVVPCFSGDTIEEEIDMIHDFYINYSDGNIPIDGVVVKSDRENSRAIFGFTDHHPKNAFAVKYSADRAETILRNIQWQVGRDSLTPVAIMDPVGLDGTVVSKASLHNWANICRLVLHKGDRVVIEKANEIIPQIVENKHQVTLDSLDFVVNTVIHRPTKCPSCGNNLAHRPLKASYADVSEEDQIEFYCPNPRCDEKLAQQIAYLGSKKVLDIDGLSIETARKIMKVYGSFVKDNGVYYIFDMTEEQFRTLPGFAEKSARNLFDAIKDSRNGVDIAHFIAACCIPGIGITVGTALMKKYCDIYVIAKVLEEQDNIELSKIDGIGNITADILCGNDFWWQFKALSEYILPVVYQKRENDSNKKSLTFVITGKLSKPRAKIQAEIEAAGHRVSNSISKNTDYLLCGDENSQSTKAKKARDLGIKVIGEKDLEVLLDAG